LESTELTAIATSLVHRAILVRQADVLGALLDGPLEESLAALTGSNSIVLTGSGVAANGTQLRRSLEEATRLEIRTCRRAGRRIGSRAEL